jgi:hypothetical protein
MNPAFFRDFAERVRALITGARTDAARQQLQQWADELDGHADAFERARAENGSVKAMNPQT